VASKGKNRTHYELVCCNLGVFGTSVIKTGRCCLDDFQELELALSSVLVQLMRNR
jgi:hypothetical protein